MFSIFSISYQRSHWRHSGYSTSAQTSWARSLEYSRAFYCQGALPTCTTWQMTESLCHTLWSIILQSDKELTACAESNKSALCRGWGSKSKAMLRPRRHIFKLIFHVASGAYNLKPIAIPLHAGTKLSLVRYDQYMDGESVTSRKIQLLQEGPDHLWS